MIIKDYEVLSPICVRVERPYRDINEQPTIGWLKCWVNQHLLLQTHDKVQ